MGIEFVVIGDDFLIARMPVTEKTMQPYGILHGGASCVLAETVGSVASSLCIQDVTKEKAVGIEINANHLRPAMDGYVYARCSPIQLGRKLHVWNIDITNEKGKPVCISRLTVMIVKATEQ
jgi:1,4-dihydroxy-2-naphthoyl-CoA hydrolase